MKTLRHIFLAAATLIFLGHAFVPHTHLSGNDEETFHHHDDDHQWLGDLIVCFFQVDHDSEDLDNFFAPDFSPPMAIHVYMVIPQTYFTQEPLASESVVISTPALGAQTLRGPPLG